MLSKQLSGYREVFRRISGSDVAGFNSLMREKGFSGGVIVPAVRPTSQ